MDKILKNINNKNSAVSKKADVCVIGAGMVGTTIAAAITKAADPSIKIHSVSSPSERSRNRASATIGTNGKNILFSSDNIKCASTCNVVMLCTPDDIIKKVCLQLASQKEFDASQKLFIHFSGAKSLKVLDPVKKAGGFVASIHPLKSFASIEESIKSLKGTIYGVTFGKNLTIDYKLFIIKLIKILKGSIIEIEDEKKSIYHASACIASNYLVSLINYALKTNEKIGIKPEESLQGLVGLIEGTVSNIKKLGSKKSLTGPIARGDTGTIKEHLDSFKTFFDESEYLIYRIMGQETAMLAYENGWIKKSTLKKFINLFQADRR